MRALVCSDTASNAADVGLALFGTASAYALCRSFLGWLQVPFDLSAAIALTMILAFVASFCWFLRVAGAIYRASACAAK